MARTVGIGMIHEPEEEGSLQDTVDAALEQIEERKC